MRATILSLLLSLCLAAQDRNARWLADADTLYQSIVALHPNPYTTTSRADFDAAYQKVRDSIPASTDAQVLLQLSRLAALANDGHTSLDFTQSSILRRYPVAFRWFSDGLYLTTAPTAQASFIGRRVTRLGSRSFDEAAATIRPWISYDTEPWFRYKAQAAFQYHELLAAAGLVEPDAPLTLELATADGQTESIEIPLASAQTIEGPQPARPRNPLYRRNPNSNYWFAWLEDSRTVYFQYNRCAESPLLPLNNFVRELIDFGKHNPVERLVFDVRENTGGNSKYFHDLMTALGAAYLSGEVPLPSAGAFGIIGKKTFSSGSLAAAEMRLSGITLVGETAGGRVSYFGEVKSVSLTNYRLTASVSTRLIQVPGFDGPLVPDLEIDFPGTAYFADEDPFLDKLVTLSRPLVPTAQRPAAR
ncbi:MAG: hypothetical protein HY821_13610 [Acidobacteria bacterium]|nr:hypothetical protein [Acidobacteriota bacterium]